MVDTPLDKFRREMLLAMRDIRFGRRSAEDFSDLSKRETILRSLDVLLRACGTVSPWVIRDVLMAMRELAVFPGLGRGGVGEALKYCVAAANELCERVGAQLRPDRE